MRKVLTTAIPAFVLACSTTALLRNATPSPSPRGDLALTGFAPAHLGEHAVAIVLPTQTWQAYNFRDDDGDGHADTWYRGGATARLDRPYSNRGVPAHFKYYEAPFLRWADRTGHEADYLSDSDLNAATGHSLRDAYELIIFSGHHEYVTSREFDAVTTFRNRGGNLMFLSANNFFWMIMIRDHVMRRIAKWRDLGRPEAALVGAQYYRNDRGRHRGPWIVQRIARGVGWLLAGTGLESGSVFSSGGVEADEIVPASPRNVQVIATITNLFGDGRNADMTYYESPSGAKVFAAGAFSLAWSAEQPVVGRLLANLWDRLQRD